MLAVHVASAGVAALGDADDADANDGGARQHFSVPSRPWLSTDAADEDVSEEEDDDDDDGARATASVPDDGVCARVRHAGRRVVRSHATTSPLLSLERERGREGRREGDVGDARGGEGRGSIDRSRGDDGRARAEDAPGEEASRVVQAREREALHVRAVPAQDDRVRRRVPHARRAAAPSARTSSSPTNRSKLMKV